MATLLTITSLHVQSRLTNISYFPSFCYWSPSMQLQVQSTFKSRLPFYTSNILSFVFIFIPILIMIRLFFAPFENIPSVVMLYNILYLGFLIFYYSFNILL